MGLWIPMKLNKAQEEELFHILTINSDYTLLAARNIISYIKKGNYLQIIYSYKVAAIEDLIKYFESEELYELCSQVRDAVYNHNKSTGKNLKLK